MYEKVRYTRGFTIFGFEAEMNEERDLSMCVHLGMNERFHAERLRYKWTPFFTYALIESVAEVYLAGKNESRVCV